MNVISVTVLLWWTAAFGVSFVAVLGVVHFGRLDVRVFTAFATVALWLTAGVYLLSPAWSVAPVFGLFAGVYSWLWWLACRVLNSPAGDPS